MNFLITGATGFIGGHLTKLLMEKGHHIYAITRSPEKYEDDERITHISYDVNPSNLPNIHGVVNLAGESLFGYWTKDKKREIRKSRLDTTRQVVTLVKQMEEKPKVFINGSAVGYYGSSAEKIFTEETTESGKDFLSSVVVDWEGAAKELEGLGIRTVYTRFGIVLGKKEGSLPLMKLPVKLFVGGKIGDGEQWVSWVHIEDAARILEFSLFNEQVTGPVNVTAPEPKRNKEFYQTLGDIHHRPIWFPTPALLLHLALGEMAGLITEGQYVYPKKMKNLGFSFRYPKLFEALESLK